MDSMPVYNIQSEVYLLLYTEVQSSFCPYMFRQKTLDRINFRSSKSSTKCTMCPHWSVGVTRCWSCAWSHDSLSHGIDKMSDPVMLSIFGVHLLMFVQVDVTFMRDLRLFQCYHLVSM